MKSPERPKPGCGEVHPGFATGKLVNAARLAAEIVAALPAGRTPEATSGRDGFIHVYELQASAGHAEIRAILRDFESHARELDAYRQTIAQEPESFRTQIRHAFLATGEPPHDK